MIITIASTKGGVGKTTSSIFLAQAAGKITEQPTTLVDTDPHASAMIASESIPEKKFVAYAAPSTWLLEKALNQVDNHEIVIIDTPTADSPPGLIKTAIKAADVVIIPTLPGTLELERTATMIDLCEAKPHGIIITRAQLNTVIYRETLDLWSSKQQPIFGVVPASTDVSMLAVGILSPRAMIAYKSIFKKIGGVKECH